MTEPSPKLPDDIGILFVHGIGHQQCGETLIEGGEGIYHWIEAWFAGYTQQRLAQLTVEQRQQWSTEIQKQWANNAAADRSEWVKALSQQLDAAREFILPATATLSPEQPAAWQPEDVFGLSVQLSDTRIDSSNDGTEAPAHARLKLLRLNGDGATHTSSWLLAESWWAEALYPPRLTDLAFWGSRVLPATIASHLGVRIRRAWQKLQTSAGRLEQLQSLVQILVDLITLPISLFIGVVMIALLFLLLLLRLLPLPWLGTFTLTVAQGLGSWLGDSYVLVANPLQTASMVGRVSRDLTWLNQHCKTVVVVAHSQGAAVVHLGLRQNIPNRLRLLFTYGSGLRKLEELFTLMRPQQNVLRLFADPLILGTISLFIGISQRLVWPTFAVPPGLFLMIGSALMVWGGIQRAATRNDRLTIWAKHFKQTGLDWQDYYASNDPVSNGPLFDDGDFPATVEVHNARSFVRDHTSYWQNHEQFIGDVVRSVINSLEDNLPRKAFQELLPSAKRAEYAKKRRQWRTQVLWQVRWLPRLSAIYLLYVHRAEWVTLRDWFSSTFSALWSGALPFTSVFTKILTFALAQPTLFLTLGALVSMQVTYLVIYAAWQTWGRGEVTALFTKESFSRYNRLRILGFILTLGFLGALTYALANPSGIARIDIDYLLRMTGAGGVLALLIGSWLLISQPHEK